MSLVDARRGVAAGPRGRQDQALNRITPKRGPAPKIEISRADKGRELLCAREELVALATDQPFEIDVPQFGLDDAAGLVDLIEQQFLRMTNG